METDEEIKQTPQWIEQEIQQMPKHEEFEEKESLMLEENKVTEFSVQFDEPFREWKNNEGKLMKIIPVINDGKPKIFWLNVANPLYKQLLEKGKDGGTHFKVMRTGQNQDTRYTLVEE